MVILEPDGSMITPIPPQPDDQSLDTLGSEIADVVMERVARRLGELESSIASRIDALHVPLPGAVRPL